MFLDHHDTVTIFTSNAKFLTLNTDDRMWIIGASLTALFYYNAHVLALDSTVFVLKYEI